MLLHRQVRVAFEEEEVFAHQVACGYPCVGVPELEIDQLVEVAAVAVVVDAWLGMFERLYRGGK